MIFSMNSFKNKTSLGRLKCKREDNIKMENGRRGDLNVNGRIILKWKMGAESEHVSAIHPVAYSVEAEIHNGGGSNWRRTISLD